MRFIVGLLTLPCATRDHLIFYPIWMRIFLGWPSLISPSSHLCSWHLFGKILLAWRSLILIMAQMFWNGFVFHRNRHRICLKLLMKVRVWLRCRVQVWHILEGRNLFWENWLVFGELYPGEEDCSGAGGCDFYWAGNSILVSRNRESFVLLVETHGEV